MHTSNYVLIRQDRSLNGRFGGGACFYIRENINYSLRLDLSVDQLENLLLKYVSHDQSLFSLSLGTDHPTRLLTNLGSLRHWLVGLMLRELNFISWVI